MPGTRVATDLLGYVGPQDQARLLEQRSGLGSTWMTTLPNRSEDSVFTSEEYCLGLKWWLGVPIIQTATTCPGCNEAVDTTGDHFLCCRRNNFANRHDAVQDAIFNILSRAGQSVAKEVTLRHTPDTLLRPADLLIDTWHEGKPTAIDVTVSHGWSVGNRSSQNNQPRDNWRPFLRKKEDLKHAKYDTPCTREGWHFLAVSLGTWGGIGPEGAKTLSRIVKRATAWETAEGKGIAQRLLYESVGVALFRQVWQLLSAKNKVR